MDTWQTIRNTLEQGKDPVVLVTGKMLVRPAKGRPGRPKRTAAQWEKLRAVAPFLGDQHRPRCVNPGCRKRLRIRNLLVCSEACRTEALRRYQTLIELLQKGLPPQDEE